MKRKNKAEYYVDNKKLSIEMQKYWDNGYISNELVKMIMTMANGLVKKPKIQNFLSVFSHNLMEAEMVQNATMRVIDKAIPIFDKDRENIFSYFYSTIENEYREIMKKESKYDSVCKESVSKYERELFEDGVISPIKNKCLYK